MSRYVVVITPETEDTEATSRHAEATIKIETAGPTPRITEMTIRSTAAGGLSAHTLPSIDLEAVVAALVAGVNPSAPVAHPETRRAATHVAETTPATAGEQAPTQQSHATRNTTDPTPSVPPDTTALGVPERAYRRMPDADEVRAAYEKIGTVTGLARHYGVPRHTAQGWMSRLRKLAAESPAGSVDAR